MASVDRWFNVMIEVVEENDGYAFIRNGAQQTSKVMSVEEALSRYDSRKIQCEMEAALRLIQRLGE